MNSLVLFLPCKGMAELHILGGVSPEMLAVSAFFSNTTAYRAQRVARGRRR